MIKLNYDDLLPGAWKNSDPLDGSEFRLFSLRFRFDIKMYNGSGRMGWKKKQLKDEWH